MSEQVFDVAQIAPQAGTFYAPGATVAAITILPCTEPVEFTLDRASQYPQEDYGRNVANQAGRGYHGVRGADGNLTGEVTYEQFMHLLEMHFKGSVAPSGIGPYTWVYPFEVGTPTLLPYTVEYGSETSQDQWEAQGVLVDELTVGFDDLDSPGAHPWTFEATCQALDRTIAAKTGSLTSTAIETMQGHLSLFKWGTTATAYASLAEISATLVSFSMTSRRYLVRRVYGSASDVATGYGFSQKSNVEWMAKLKIGASTKSDIHDAWNSSGSVLGEKRARITIDGAGNNVAHLDFRAGMLAVPVGERDGERVYEVSGEGAYDSTLAAPAQWTVVDDISDLTP